MLQQQLTDLFNALAGLQLSFRIGVRPGGSAETPRYEWWARIDCEGDDLKRVLTFAEANDLHVKAVEDGLQLVK